MSLLEQFHGQDLREKVKAVLHSLVSDVAGDGPVTGHDFAEVIWALAEVAGDYGTTALEDGADAETALAGKEAQIEDALWVAVYGSLDDASLRIQKAEEKASEKVYAAREAARKREAKSVATRRLVRAAMGKKGVKEAIRKAAKKKPAKKKAAPRKKRR